MLEGSLHFLHGLWNTHHRRVGRPAAAGHGLLVHERQDVLRVIHSVDPGVRGPAVAARHDAVSLARRARRGAGVAHVDRVRYAEVAVEASAAGAVSSGCG